MSRPVLVDFLLPNGMLMPGISRWTASDGTSEEKMYNDDVLKANAKFLQEEIRNGLAQDNPRPFYIRDAWMIKAIGVRRCVLDKEKVSASDSQWVSL